MNPSSDKAMTAPFASLRAGIIALALVLLPCGLAFAASGAASNAATPTASATPTGAAVKESPKEPEVKVKITHDLPYVDLAKLPRGKSVRLERNQDQENTIDFENGRTSRPCPPYCIQPISLSPGIETVGELEVIQYLKRIAGGDNTVLVIDSRTENWLGRGMLPGAIHIPWTKLHFEHTEEDALMEILEIEFGVNRHGRLLNFENAKTLVIYCNGNWCGQSPTVIRSLRMLGYPEQKLKWYRDGIQGWALLGLTLVDVEGNVIR